MAIFSTKTEETKTDKKGGASAPKKAKSSAGKESVLAEKVLMRPRITEKGYALNALNQYVFIVAPAATKHTVKRAVEEAYGVTVQNVRICQLPRKKKRVGASSKTAYKSALKKAVVSVAKGQTIELFKAGM